MKGNCKVVHSSWFIVHRNRSRKYNLSCGQSLIEVVVGLAVATLLAIALISTTVYTSKLSRSAKNNTQASKLAQQTIEQWRIYRDRVSSGFSALPGSGCVILDASAADPALWQKTSLAACTPAPPNGVPNGAQKVTLDKVDFWRWAEFSTPTSAKKSLKVTIAWVESSGWISVTTQTFLSSVCTGQIGGGPSPCP